MRRPCALAAHMYCYADHAANTSTKKKKSLRSHVTQRHACATAGSKTLAGKSRGDVGLESFCWIQKRPSEPFGFEARALFQCSERRFVVALRKTKQQHLPRARLRPDRALWGTPMLGHPHLAKYFWVTAGWCEGQEPQVIQVSPDRQGVLRRERITPGRSCQPTAGHGCAARGHRGDYLNWDLKSPQIA